MSEQPRYKVRELDEEDASWGEQPDFVIDNGRRAFKIVDQRAAPAPDDTRELVRRIEAQIDECGPDSNDGDDFYAIEGDTLLRVLSDTRTALLRAGPAVATPPDALRAAFDAGARWGFQMWAFPMTGAQIEAEAARRYPAATGAKEQETP